MNSRTPGCKYKLLALAVAAATSSVQAEQSQKDLEKVETETLIIVGQATSGLDTLITADQLEAYQATDLADTFRYDPTITAGGSVTMGQKIYMRNLGEDSLHISVDGAEQAASTFHHSGRTAIEPELLKQIEIEAGAGSAAAGPGALGGSIRFVTKDPEDMLDSGKNVGVLLKSSYYSNGDGWKNTATLSGQTDTGSVGGMLSLTGFKYDNMDDGNGDEIGGTESDKQLGFGKFVAKFAESHKLTVSHENLEEEGDINYKPEFADNPQATDWKRKTSILNYDFEPAENDLVDFSINLYKTESDQSRYYASPRFPQYNGVYGGVVETTGLTIQNKSIIGMHELVYGINYRDDDSTLYSEAAGPSHDENGKVKGIYVQDIISVNEQLTVSAGLRFDDYELRDVHGQNLSDNGVSPNISANYEIKPGVSISAGYAEAFRGPEVRDSMKLESYNNDPELEGERAKNLELGMNFDGDDYAVAVGVYRSVIEDPILQGGGIPWNKTYTNLEDDIETKGIFMRAEKSWEQLTLGVSANIADTEVGGVDASRYMYGSSANSIGDTLAFTLDYQATPSLQLGWSAELVKGFNGDTIHINDTIYGDTYDLNYRKKGYAVHDIYARWMPMADDQLTVTLSVNNLFDKQYISHASIADFTQNPGWDGIIGSPSEGRDIRLSAALRF